LSFNFFFIFYINSFNLFFFYFKILNFWLIWYIYLRIYLIITIFRISHLTNLRRWTKKLTIIFSLKFIIWIINLRVLWRTRRKWLKSLTFSLWYNLRIITRRLFSNLFELAENKYWDFKNCFIIWIVWVTLNQRNLPSQRLRYFSWTW